MLNVLCNDIKNLGKNGRKEGRKNGRTEKVTCKWQHINGDWRLSHEYLFSIGLLLTLIISFIVRYYFTTRFIKCSSFTLGRLLYFAYYENSWLNDFEFTHWCIFGTGVICSPCWDQFSIIRNKLAVSRIKIWLIIKAN